LGSVEREQPGALAHSSRWWLTTAGRGAAVKADSRRRRWPQASLYSGFPPSHPRTEDRWPGCGIPSLRMPLSGLAAVPAGGALNVARVRRHRARERSASDQLRGMSRSGVLQNVFVCALPLSGYCLSAMRSRPGLLRRNVRGKSPSRAAKGSSASLSGNSARARHARRAKSQVPCSTATRDGSWSDQIGSGRHVTSIGR
jgi:hypothetical protein